MAITLSLQSITNKFSARAHLRFSSIFKTTHCIFQLASKMLIFLSGKRLSGKDTLGNVLARIGNTLGYSVCLDAFANHLKAIYTKREGLDYKEFLETRALKEAHRDSSTAFYKDLVAKDVNCFSSIVLSHYESFVKENLKPLYIVTDLRFAHDLDPFIRAGIPFQTIHVGASDATRLVRGWIPSSYDQDSCEVVPDISFDCVMNNNHSLQDLEKAVVQFFGGEEERGEEVA